MELKLYYCAHCGNIIYKVVDKGVPVMCCGEKMQEMTPNTTDGATEKHVPVIETNGHTATIKVGDVPHPMMDEHYITMIAAVVGNKVTFTQLKPGDEPKTVVGHKDGPIHAYEYCNLHGLWKAEK
ncbi:MAG: desulfoferrodoxin [Oscillospiraceae bacterium]|nr:desulfoferrodoxin [Oscillospiraceae bacterium]